MREKVKFTGSDTEGGITSGYQMNDGVKLKVPYSFFGSIYDEDEEEALKMVLKQEAQTMGPQVTLFQKEFAEAFKVLKPGGVLGIVQHRAAPGAPADS